MAMLRDRRHVNVPPGGWRYVQPETGVWFNSDTFEDLVSAVSRHREYKGLPRDDIPGDVEHQICTSLGPDWCFPEFGEDHRPVRDRTAELTTAMVLGLSKALAVFILKGAVFVDAAEAEARAKTCRGCPFNKPASACACAKAYDVIESLIPQDRRLAGISVCMACGCSLQAKANLPLEVIKAVLPADMVLPSWCWQRDALALET